MVERWITFATNNLFTLAFPTTTNTTYTLEHAASLNPTAWTTISTIGGDGVEKVLFDGLSNIGFYRVRVGP